MKRGDYLNLATKIALKGVYKYRLGAVVVKGNKVLGLGCNKMYKTHPIMQKFNRDTGYLPGLHAEVNACLGVSPEALRGATVYVVRLMKNDAPSLAKPCVICQGFLRGVGIQEVFYSIRSLGGATNTERMVF